MNRLAIILSGSLIALGGYVIGYGRGHRAGPEAAEARIAEQETLRRFDEHFLAMLVETPDDRELLCDRIIEDVSDLLADEALTARD